MPADPSPLPPPSICAVLAGGRGRRLGGAKPTTVLAGRPLIDYAIAAAREAGLTPVIVAKPDTDLAAIEGAPDPPRILREPAEPSHPLLGLATALDALSEPLVACPCDAPLLPPALLSRLMTAPGEVVAVQSGGRLEPLIGRYPSSAAAELRRAALAGRPAQEAIRKLEPRLISERALRALGDPATMLRNVNTPADLRAVELLLEPR